MRFSVENERNVILCLSPLDSLYFKMRKRTVRERERTVVVFVFLLLVQVLFKNSYLN